MEKIVKLKPGKEKALLNRHHWIFSGAIARMPSYEDGDILPVFSSSMVQLGSAYFNRKSSIIGRMVAYGEEDPYATIKKSLEEAISYRRQLMPPKTNCIRWINAEGDFLPGLVVDGYEDVLVIQISTLGMDKLKSIIVDELHHLLKPRAIYEKSTVPSRKEEGLPMKEEVLYGDLPRSLEVMENGLKFFVNPREGQKTGFFLDQREMRSYVKSLSQGKRVLNCFSYTGGFTVYALSGGAKKVDSVDISKEAVLEAKRNCELNGFTESTNQFIDQDAFEFLRFSELDYDLVILDPPAFAKKAKDVVPACRGYKDINRLAMQRMPKESMLLTSSCSHFIDEKLFQQVVFQAAVEAKREVRILSKHRQAFDHPINIFHPEGEYLKSFILYVK